MLLPLASAQTTPASGTISAGASHLVALKADGTVWAWGLNTNGQLGDGATVDRSIPFQLTSPIGVASLAAGSAHTLALKTDGTVTAWGLNTNGQLGDSSTTQRTAAVAIPGLTGITAIAAGGSHSLALKADGTVWVWGLNANGQLGDGTTTQRIAPFQLTSLSGIVAITAGSSHSLALKSDGSVWVWGLNTNGQLGDGTTTQRTAPFQLTSLVGVSGVTAGGARSHAFKPDGTVWSWGLNSNGQLGDATTTQRTTPVQVTTLTGITAVSAGISHTLAVKSDGTVWAWGLNSSGQLGDGTLTQRTAPVQVIGVTTGITVAGGAAFSAILKSDGTVLSLGDNTNGQLGDGVSTGLRLVPLQATTLVDITGVGAGANHTLAISSNQGMWAWGTNSNGQLGDNSTTTRKLAVQVGSITGATKTAGGASHTLALKSDGTLWAWGLNTNGQIGDGSTTQRNVPVQVGTLSTVVAFAAGNSHSLAAKADGTAWSWGLNTNGQLGDGSTTQALSPVAIGALSGIAKVAAGASHSLALKSDGTVWVWGLNTNGQLGDGATAQRATPFQLTTLTGITAVSAGSSFSLALKSDGTVWAWGLNTSGQLGDGTTTQRTAPVQVSSLTNVTAIAAGATHALALKLDGTVWAWGLNTSGQLGDGTLIQRSSPVAVANLASVSAVAAGSAHSLALRTDKTLRIWGKHSGGQLGIAVVIKSAAAIALKSSGADTDQDGLPDSWETTSFGNLAQTGTGDADGDGLTNIQEYIGGTNPAVADIDQDLLTDVVDLYPADYFNAQVPSLAIVSGNNQLTAPSQFNPQAFDVAVWNAAGTVPLVNAPVTYSVSIGGGKLATTNIGSPALVASLPLRTDGDGTAQAFYKQPATSATASQILFTAGGAQVALQSTTTGADTVKPSVPTGLASSAIAVTSFTLSWTASTDNMGVTGYDVFKGGLLQGSSATTTYNVTGLLPATAYSMTVKAKDAAGNISNASTALPVTTLADTTAPAKPTALVASAIAASSFTLAWTAATDDVAVTGYDIYRGATLAGSSATTTYNLTGLTPSTAYSMTVKAKDAAGNISLASNALPVTTTADTQAPAIPTGLASASVATTSFTLNWTATTDNVAVTGYEIYKAGTLAGTSATPTFNVTGLAPATAYSMTVKAKDAANNLSAASAPLVVTTTADTQAPAAPTALASASITATSFTLSWTAATDNIGVTGYDIYKGGVLAGSSATTSFSVTGLAPSTAYSMTVKAKDAAGNASVASSAKVVTTVADTTVPTAPTSPVSSAITATTFTLSWTAATDNVAVTGYNVYKAGTLVGSPAGTATTYSVTSGLAPSTAYSMTVKAKDAAGNLSAASSALVVTTTADTTAPGAPTALASASITPTSFTLTWTAPVDNVGVTGYFVFRDGSQVGTPISTSFSVTGLAPATAYTMTVKARDAAGNISVASTSKLVTTANDTTAPSVPAGLVASALTSSSFTLSWTASTDAIGVTGYDIYKDGILAGSSATLSFGLSGLTAGTTYSMTVKAKDATGNISAASTSLPVATLSSGAPAAVTGLKLWLLPDSLSAGSLATWLDQSGNAKNATQTDPSLRPTVVTNQLNGKPIVHFDGGNKSLNLPDFMSTATEGEVFILVRTSFVQGDGSYHGFWRMGLDAAGNYYTWPDGRGADDFGSDVRRDFPINFVNTQDFNIYNVSAKAGEWTVRLNGRVAFSEASNTVGFRTDPCIGRNLYDPFSGDIAEMIVYNHVLTTTERDSIYSYLATKFLPPGLPAPTTPSLQVAPAGSSGSLLIWSVPNPTYAYTTSVERKTGAGAFSAVGATSDKSTYDDTALSPGATFTYRVRVSNAAGTSGYSNEASLTLPMSGGGIVRDGMTLWLSADLGLPAAGQFASWPDLSGLGHNPSQAVAASRPTVVGNQSNGKPAVHFDGVDDFLDLPDFMSTATEGEVFIVLRTSFPPPDGIHHGLWQMGGDYIGGYYPWADGKVGDDFGSEWRRDVPVTFTNLGEFNIYNVSARAGEWIARFNGRVALTDANNVVHFRPDPVLGRNEFDSFLGDIAEVVVYNRVVTPSERDTIYTYLAGKYQPAGIPVPPAATLQIAAPSSTSAILAWTFPGAEYPSSSSIERKTGSGMFSVIGSVSGRVSFEDTTVTANTTYTYRVRVSNYAGTAGYSNEVTITTPLGSTGIARSGLRLWLRADLGLPSSGKVPVWPDVSGLNHSAFQVDAAKQPIAVANAQNGKPAVHFDGTNAWLQLPNFMAGATAGEWIVVLKAAEDWPNVTRSGWRIGSDHYGTFYPASNGEIGEGFGTAERYGTGNPPTPLDQYHVYDVTAQNGAYAIRFNGTVIYSNTTNVVAYSEQPLLGRTGFEDNFFKGDIAEVMAYDRALTAPERDAIHSYLAVKYAPPAIPVPATPTLQATPLSTSSALLAWDFPSIPSIVNASIERKIGTGAFVPVSSVVNGHVFTDTGLSTSTTYTYRVKLSTYAGASAYSNEVTVSTIGGGSGFPATGVRLWLRSDMGLPSAGAVSKWMDVSGGGNDATQAEVGFQPLRVNSQLNGQPWFDSIARMTGWPCPISWRVRVRGKSILC